MRKNLLVIVFLLLVQACSTIGGSGEPFAWDGSKSTALNLLIAIDVDDVDEDRVLPKEYERIERKNGEVVDFTTGIVEGVGASRELSPVSGSFDSLGSLSMGVLSWMASGRDERYSGENHIIYYVPADTLGTPKEIFAEILKIAATDWTNNWNSLVKKQKVTLFDAGMLSRFGSEAPGYSYQFDRDIKKKFTYKVKDLGVVKEEGLPPALRGRGIQWRLLDGEASWNNFWLDFSDFLPETAYHYIINSRKHGNNPVIMNKGKPLFFIKPVKDD